MAKESKIAVKVSGVCLIIVDGVHRHPGEVFDVEESKLKTSAFEYLIAKGDLEVKDNSALNEEIKQSAASKRKKDPREGKSKAELEDGGIY